MKNALDILCSHAAKTLPDSISERKSVLRAMEKVLRTDHSVYRDVQAQLAAISALEKLNTQMQMRFTGGAK
jgi:hypothetical protein